MASANEYHKKTKQVINATPFSSCSHIKKSNPHGTKRFINISSQILDICIVIQNHVSTGTIPHFRNTYAL